MNKIGIWKIGNLIEKKGDTSIYNIVPTKDDSISEENLKDLLDTNWVIKLVFNYYEEIIRIEQYEIYKQSCSIKMPLEKTYRSGKINDHGWFAMEKYDSNLYKNFSFGKDKINLLITNIIDFIEWLHIEKKIIHGDVKAENILINFKNVNRPFCLIDFESLSKPHNLTCENHLSTGYYYYALGCEKDKPYYSYRMDLQAFGMILWNLTLSVNKFHNFEWQKIANDNYINNNIDNEFIYLESLKSMGNIKNNLVTKYFEIIDKVNWYDTNIDPEIYKNLKNIVK